MNILSFMNYCFYFFVGLAYSYFLVKLWGASARGNYIACFLFSFGVSLATLVESRLQSKDELISFAICAMGHAIGVAYGVYTNHKKQQN